MGNRGGSTEVSSADLDWTKKKKKIQKTLQTERSQFYGKVFFCVTVLSLSTRTAKNQNKVIKIKQTLGRFQQKFGHHSSCCRFRENEDGI